MPLVTTQLTMTEILIVIDVSNYLNKIVADNDRLPLLLNQYKAQLNGQLPYVELLAKPVPAYQAGNILLSINR